jgi:hypothetical protein
MSYNKLTHHNSSFSLSLLSSIFHFPNFLLSFTHFPSDLALASSACSNSFVYLMESYQHVALDWNIIFYSLPVEISWCNENNGWMSSMHAPHPLSAEIPCWILMYGSTFPEHGRCLWIYWSWWLISWLVHCRSAGLFSFVVVLIAALLSDICILMNIRVGIRLGFYRQSVDDRFPWNFQDLFGTLCHWCRSKWELLYSLSFEDRDIQRYLQRGSHRICNCISHRSWTPFQMRHILWKSRTILITFQAVYSHSSSIMISNHI